VRWWVSGPSLGPLHTTLASGRVGGTRRRRSRGPWWPHRFRSLLYWAAGLWAIEAAFWTVYALVWAGVWCWRHRPVRPGTPESASSDCSPAGQGERG
jgi:hypothetical protein